MFIINFIKKWVIGSRSDQFEKAYIIVDGLRGGTSLNGYDVDDFLHGAFTSNTLKEAGRLCNQLAFLFPGDISGMYSQEAIAYLSELADSLRKGEAEAENSIKRIQEKLAGQ